MILIILLMMILMRGRQGGVFGFAALAWHSSRELVSSLNASGMVRLKVPVRGAGMVHRHSSVPKSVKTHSELTAMVAATDVHRSARHQT